jgi:hypothetical protein
MIRRSLIFIEVCVLQLPALALNLSTFLVAITTPGVRLFPLVFYCMYHVIYLLMKGDSLAQVVKKVILLSLHNAIGTVSRIINESALELLNNIVSNIIDEIHVV